MWSYFLDRKWKLIFLEKNTWKYDIFFKCSEKMAFSKNLSGIWYYLYYLKRWFISPKKWYFFFGRKMKDDPSQEIHGNMIFSVYTYRCFKHDIMPLCQKKIKDYLTKKSKLHLKVIDILDWYSRKSSNNSLYFYGDHYKCSYIAFQKKKQET